MKIMTFNIRGALYEDGLNHWRHRADLNVRTIQHHAPDLIGLQEAHLENLAYYRQHLPGYAIEQGYPYNNREPYQYTSIAWNPERLRPLESGGFWLSETPDVLSGSWGTACFRSATWVIFEWLPTGLKFIHLNTHLDHVSELARQQAALLITQRLEAQISLPVLITGDFNCMPGSAAYRAFQAVGFVDTYSPDALPAITFHAFQGSAYLPNPQEADRMDWIMLRGWETRAQMPSCQIIRDAEPPLYPSDHYPLMADLRLTWQAHKLL